MKLFADISKVDDEQRLVYGYASTEARDNQNEIVTRKAMEGALPGYMKFANIREMHQSSAVGVAKDAQMDDKGVVITAHVVDDSAWAKVKAGVYKGFSIGGRATSRDPLDKTIITGLDLTEISLVDRPANPEAVIDLYKVDEGDTTDVVPLEEPAAEVPVEAPVETPTTEEATEKRDIDTKERKEMANDGRAMEDGSFPVVNQADLETAIKAIGRAKDPAAAKAHIKERAKALGLEKLIPDTWKADAGGDVAKSGEANVEKGMYGVANFASLLAQVKDMQACSAAEEARERDTASTMPNDLQAWLATGVQLLSSMAAEEGSELVNDPAPKIVPEIIMMADKPGDIEKKGARISAADQGKLDAAHDALVAAGANCGGAAAGTNSEKADLATEIAKVADPLNKRLADLEGQNEILKAELHTADNEKAEIAKRNADLVAENEKLKALPAPDAKAPVLKVVGKADDIGVDTTQKAAATPDPQQDKWFKFAP